MTNPPEDPPPSSSVAPLLPIATADDVTSHRRNDAGDAMALPGSDVAEEEKPLSPIISIPSASREVSEVTNEADLLAETGKVENDAEEAAMLDGNEVDEKAVAAMEMEDRNVPGTLGEIATEVVEICKVEDDTNVDDLAVETRKVEEVINVADIAEDSGKVEEDNNVDDVAVETIKVEEVTNVADVAEETGKVEEDSNVDDVTMETRKVEEVTNVADIAEETGKVEEDTNLDDVAVETRKVEEVTYVADIAETVKVEEDADEAMSHENEEEEKIVVGTEMVDAYVACSNGETMEVVETRKVEEEADEVAMADKNEEAENKVMGTEMTDLDVACTLRETTEADRVEMGDEIREAEDKEEGAEMLNVAGVVEGTTDREEDADGAGAGVGEEAVEAEEVEVANEADLMEEDEDVADMTEYTEAAEMAEEQSRSVSGGKRKRGRNAKSTGRAPVRKKVEEDVCFICFDGGELVLCDRRGCPKAYHPTCVNRDDAFFRAKGKWNCGWHLCSNCEKNAYYMCYTCTFSLCKGCIKDAVIFCVRGNKGFCETCMRTVMLIEQNELGNKDTGQVDFDDKNSWEYLFKDYYTDLKEKLSLTYDDIARAKNPWKGSDTHPTKEDSPDELYDANNDVESHSDSSSENVETKRRKAKRRLKPRSREGNSRSPKTLIGAKGSSSDDRSEWASKELLEFVMHMRNGDKSVLSQFDVQALLLEYIKRNKLRDPRRKSQIICDVRLQNLFGKPRVGHFEMLKLLESHFLLKEDSQAEDQQGSVVDTEVNPVEGDGNTDSYGKAGKDKKRKTRKKGDGLQSNPDDYAAIDNHNINLIYLRRNLVEDLLEDTDKFHDKAVGSFVRIRISGSGQKQDLYRLVQVVGTCKAAEPYKVGKRMTDILLEILNLNKTEVVSIDIISNQEFTEDECKRLRQSIKCGLITRLTVGDIQDKAMTLQAVRVKDWLETETVRLSHLRDRASEKGRRKELRECVEKLQLLKTPEERQRRLEEIPEIHVDPNMDPSYESEEDEDEMDHKRLENYMRPRGTAFDRRGRDIVSPRTGGSISNDSWSGARNYPNVNRELSRNLSNKGFSTKADDVSNAAERLNDVQMPQGRDRETHLSNSWEGQRLYSSLESSVKSTQRVVVSEPFSTTVSEPSALPSPTGKAPPTVKINEAEKMWHYKDPSGKIQGPFSMVQLRKWNNTGYFPVDLRIWRNTDKQDESILLTDALAGNFSKEPPMVDKTPPKAQIVHNLQLSSSPSGNLHLPAQQGIEGHSGGRPTLGHSGSYNSRSSVGSLGQTTGGSWRSEDNNSTISRPSQIMVEVPKIPANGRGSDAGARIDTTNLPSPTPQTTSYGNKGQAFENKWSPTPAQPAGSLVGSPFLRVHGGGVQAPVVPENVAHSAESGSSSQAPKPDNKSLLLSSTGIPIGHPHATASPMMADTSRNVTVDGKTATMQNMFMSGHNSHAEAQGWGSGLVQKHETAASNQLRGGEPQAWGGVHSRVESNNPPSIMPAQPPTHGQWGDASSVQNPASFNTGNPMGNFQMPGIQDFRPPTSSNQPNITAPSTPSMPWGMVAENQNTSWGVMPGNPNMSWGGPLPANMSMNWMHGQVAAPGNANPGWAASGQGPSPVNAAGWVPPGQGHPNANAGWVVPGQGMAPGSANPGWAAPAGNQGMWGNEQSHNGDRFPNHRDRGSHGGDSGYGGDKQWNRQSSFNSGGRGGGGGGPSGPSFGAQRGVCKFHESGHCKKGAYCDYLHT